MTHHSSPRRASSPSHFYLYPVTPRVFSSPLSYIRTYSSYHTGYYHTLVSLLLKQIGPVLIIGDANGLTKLNDCLPATASVCDVS